MLKNIQLMSRKIEGLNLTIGNTYNYYMKENYQWYGLLRKPSFSPPSWVFGPVWTILYLLIAVSFGRVFIMAFERKIPLIVLLPFLLNLIFNAAFTPLQFGLKNNFYASIDILLVLLTLLWALVSIYSYAEWVTFVNIPYVLWVCFATTLQLSITFLNK